MLSEYRVVMSSVNVMDRVMKTLQANVTDGWEANLRDAVPAAWIERAVERLSVEFVVTIPTLPVDSTVGDLVVAVMEAIRKERYPDV